MTEHNFEVSPPTSHAVPDRGPVAFGLIPNFLLGSATWSGVGEVLGRLGYESAIVDTHHTTTRDVDHIGPWVDHVVATLDAETTGPIVLVAHSTSCARLPLVAERLLRRGREVHSLLAVNGRLAWPHGLSPVDVHRPLAGLLDSIVRPDDYLPPWHRWWGSMILDMIPNDEIRRRVFTEAKPIPRALFDQAIEVPELPESVRFGFLATGKSYEPAYDRAKAAGWSVARLDGEHLHIVVDPVTVAGMLLSLIGHCSSITSPGDNAG